MSLLYGCVALAGIAALLAFHRLLWGPSAADRVVGLDLMFAAAVLLCVASALITGRTAFLDVALGLAIAGFVATLAWSRWIDRLFNEKEDTP